MTEKASDESAASSSREVNCNTPDATPMEVDDVEIVELDGNEEASSASGTPASSPSPAVAKTPTSSFRKSDKDCFKTPESVTPSSAKKRKRLTPDEKNAKEQERQEKRRKLEEEKQRKEQEKAEKAKQREEEKQKKDEEKRRQEEEKKLERLKKEEERKKAEEEKKQERLKKEEERKRIEEERKQERLKKEEERKKKEDEKKQKLEEKEKERQKIEDKKAKQANVLLKFLQKSSAPKVQTIDSGSVYPSTSGSSGTTTSSDSKGNNESDDIVKDPSLFNPLPFQIKTDMAVAPLCRREKLSDVERGQLDFLVQYNVDCGIEFDFGDSSIDAYDGYLNSLKNGNGRCFEKTDIKCVKENSPDIQILDDDNRAKTPEVISGCVKWRMKLLQFHENRRPAYWGTWKKKARRVTARRPTVREEEVEYEFDSDDEWEDEPEDAEEIVDSDREEKEEQEDGGDPEDDEEGWMVPHGYLSDTEREGTGGDLESMKCKEKEFYKSLKEKTLIGLPFIQTEDLSCFIMRLCPVFKSAITIKPVRRRPKKPSQSKKVENKPMEEVNKQMEAESKPMEVESKPMEDESKPMKAESKQTDMASKVERRSVRTPKVPKPNPYDKAPSGFLGMQLPSDDEEDMDWDTEEDLDASSSSDSNSNESGDEEDDGSSSGDEDLFTPIKVVRRKV